MREEGSVSIQDDVLRLHENGRLTEIPLPTDAEKKAAYIQYFGMPAESLADIPG